MFMATDPERFGPDSARTYTQIELYGPERDRLRDFYRGYFVDFIDEFKNRIGKRKLRMLEDGGIVAPRGGSPAACVDDVLNAIVP
jgi:hypothetical protein